jgi:hypothetical protein
LLLNLLPSQTEDLFLPHLYNAPFYSNTALSFLDWTLYKMFQKNSKTHKKWKPFPITSQQH